MYEGAIGGARRHHGNNGGERKEELGYQEIDLGNIASQQH